MAGGELGGVRPCRSSVSATSSPPCPIGRVGSVLRGHATPVGVHPSASRTRTRTCAGNDDVAAPLALFRGRHTPAAHIHGSEESPGPTEVN